MVLGGHVRWDSIKTAFSVPDSERTLLKCLRGYFRQSDHIQQIGWGPSCIVSFVGSLVLLELGGDTVEVQCPVSYPVSPHRVKEQLDGI